MKLAVSIVLLALATPAFADRVGAGESSQPAHPKSEPAKPPVPPIDEPPSPVDNPAPAPVLPGDPPGNPPGNPIDRPIDNPIDKPTEPPEPPVDTPPGAPIDKPIEPPTPPIAPPVKEHTAAEVAGAPEPGDESGRTDADGGDSIARRLARAALFIPKLVFELGMAPIHGTVWAFDRYQLDSLYYRVFYNADRTIGITPTATFETGFGGSLGARFVDNDLFGDKELIAFQGTTGAVYGEPYRESFLGELRSGKRLGSHLGLALVGNFTRRPADPFYGIGNGHVQHGPDGGIPIDPVTDDTEIETYHRYQEANVALTADVKPIKEVHVILTGSLTELKYARSTTGEVPIDAAYDTSKIPGFLDGVQHAYAGAELRLDTRRKATAWEPVISTGSLVAAYAGRIHRLDGGSDYTRYGAELQHYFRLSRGPRVLITRLRGEAVTGNLDDVPFTELPSLGGGQFMRGYQFERFRDRVAMFGSVQYQWDLSHFTDAYVFTDVGRVYSDLDAVTVRGMRMGYGVGVEIHHDTGFLLEATVASSIDGGLFFSVSFNPVFDARPRWR